MSTKLFRKYSASCLRVNHKHQSTHSLIAEGINASDDTTTIYIDMTKSDVFGFIDSYLGVINDVDMPKALLTSNYESNVPFIVSLTLKHGQQVNDSTYDNIEEFTITILAEFIKEQVNLSQIDYALKLSLMTSLLFISSEAPDCISIYVVFPALRMAKADAEEKLNALQLFLRTKLAHEFSVNGEIHFDNLHESFLDVNVYNHGCPMYGSCIDNYSFRLFNPTIYSIKEDRNDGSMKIEEVLDNAKGNMAIDAFILSRMSGYATSKSSEDVPLAKLDSLYDKYGKDHLLFIAMSTNYNNSFVLPTSAVVKNTQTTDVYEPKDDKEIFTDLMAIITKKSRVFNRENVWMDVGNIANTLYGPVTGLEVWKSFTLRLSTKYNDEDCDERFFSLVNRVIGIKTVAHHVQKYFAGRYKDWHSKWVKSAFLKMCYFNESEIAEAFYRMYWLKYVCDTASSNDGWYVFKGPYWIKMEGRSAIVKDLNSGFVARVREHIRYLVNKSSREAADSSGKDVIDAVVVQFNKMSKQLGMYNASRTLTNMMYMFETDIKSKFDYNINLFPFNNVVAECIGENVIIRDGYPEDYILRYAPHPYMDYTINSKPVKMLLKYYREMFETPELIMYNRKLHAARLLSGNKDKIFVFEIGGTGGSKSQYKKLRDLAFGENKFTFTSENTVLTTKKKGSGPRPETNEAFGVRMLFFCEFDVGDKLEANGLLKTWSGNDVYFDRSLHSNGGLKRTTFCVHCQSNDPPSLGCFDDAMRDRFNFLPFESKWRKKGVAPESYEEQCRTRTYLKDDSFERKLKIMAPAFLWLLVNDFPLYMKEGLEMPKVCKDKIEKYWRENDFYSKFLYERMIKTEVISDIIDLTTVYSAFTEWYRQNYPSSNDIGRKSFVYEIKDECRMGEYYNEVASVWSGWKLKTDSGFSGGMGVSTGMNGFSGGMGMGVEGIAPTGVIPIQGMPVQQQFPIPLMNGA